MIRSMLFLPGNTPNMLINAHFLGADAVIYDLEDAVSPAEKDSARILVRNTLMYLKPKASKTVVRINSTDTPYWREDIETIAPCNPDYILLPKASDPRDARLVAELVAEKGDKSGSTGIILLIETALGVENAYLLATCHPTIKALLLGAEDLTSDLQCIRTREGAEIEYARTRLVCAARAAGIEVYDTPFTHVDDEEGIEKDTAKAKSLGFSGKAAISPRHIATINRLFSPTMEEIEYAYEVTDAIESAMAEGKGVVSLRGKMIDAPIVARARRIIDAAARLGIEREDTHE